MNSLKNNVSYNPDDDYIYINGKKWRKANLVNFVLLGENYTNSDYSWSSGDTSVVIFNTENSYHDLNRTLSGYTAVVWSNRQIDLSGYSKMILKLQGVSGSGLCGIGVSRNATKGKLTQSLSNYFDYVYKNTVNKASNKVMETLEIDISSLNTSAYIGFGIADNPGRFTIMDLYLE